MFGHYTCYLQFPNGASVVHYVMVSEGILDEVLHFKVADFIPTLSDTHCKLEWTMSARYNIQKDDIVSIHHMEPNFICSDDSSYKFQLAMCSSDIQNKLLEFKNNCIEVTQVSVDEATIELTDLILSVAHSSLKKPKVTKTSPSKPKNKKMV